MPWRSCLVGLPGLMILLPATDELGQILCLSVVMGVIFLHCALLCNLLQSRGDKRHVQLPRKSVDADRPQEASHPVSGLGECALSSPSKNVKSRHRRCIEPQQRYSRYHCYHHHHYGLKKGGKMMAVGGAASGHGHVVSKVLMTRDISAANLNELLGRGKGSSNVSAWCLPNVQDNSTAHTVVGNLHLAVDGSFKPESAFYRFPVELKRYVHEDGSVLTLVSEDLSSVGGDMTTEAYKRICIQRAEQLAHRRKVYFKVRHDTPASYVVTTIMNWFLGTTIGTPQMFVISSFLVRDHLAYTVQLQTRQDLYEMHLVNFLFALQSARIERTIPSPPSPFQCLTLRSTVGGEAYALHIPLQFIATRIFAGNVIALRHRHACGWSGEVLTEAPVVGGDNNGGEEDHEGKNDGTHNATMNLRSLVTLIPSRLYLSSQWHRDDAASASLVREVEKLLLEVRASVILQDVKEDLVTNRYVSEKLVMPLPPITLFTTNVCSHGADAFVNLFLQSKSGKAFEIEVGALSVGKTGSLTNLFSLLFSSPEQHATTPAGKDTVWFAGEAENGMSLRIDAIHSTDAEFWCIVKCLHAIDTQVPTELLQYIGSVLDALSLTTSWLTSCAAPCSD